MGPDNLLYTFPIHDHPLSIFAQESPLQLCTTLWYDRFGSVYGRSIDSLTHSRICPRQHRGLSSDIARSVRGRSIRTQRQINVDRSSNCPIRRYGIKYYLPDLIGALAVDFLYQRCTVWCIGNDD